MASKLKIEKRGDEILIVHCCSNLSQNVPKFELYKHNDELFNMYYRIFLWTLNFCRFWPIMQIRKKGGFKSSPLKPLNQIKPNLAGMVPGWVPFKIVSDSPALHSRWQLLLKLEISSNGQNCSILSQNVPKFELWTFADFDRLCKLGGWNFKKIFSETTESISTKLCWNDSWVVLFQNCVQHFRTPTKMAATAELNLT